MWAFAAGIYEQAAEHLRVAVVNDPGDGTSRYWLGLALVRLGRIEEAMGEIEGALMAQRPARIEPRDALAAAKAQIATGDTRGAAETLEAALVATHEPVDRRPPFDGNLEAAVGADSNPHLLSEELALPLPGKPPRRVVRGAEGDAASELQLRLGFHPFHRRGRWNLGVTLGLGHSFHQDFTELDLGRARAAIHLARGADPQGSLNGPLGATRVPFGSERWSAVLQAGVSRYRLGGESYLDSLEGAAALAFRASPASVTQLELAYADRQFAEQELADPRRSGSDATLRLSQSKSFRRAHPPQAELPDGPPPSLPHGPTLRLSALAMDRDASREFTASAYEGRAELIWPLGLSWTAGLEAAARRDEFDHRESNLFDQRGPARRDTTLRAATTLSWRASTRLLWIARVARTDRDSNVDLGVALPDLDYRRTVATFGASWAF